MASSLLFPLRGPGGLGNAVGDGADAFAERLASEKAIDGVEQADGRQIQPFRGCPEGTHVVHLAMNGWVQLAWRRGTSTLRRSGSTSASRVLSKVERAC